MSVELVQRDDRNTNVDVENPMNISGLFVRQSPSRRNTQPLFPASGASRMPVPSIDLGRPKSDEFTRYDRRPSSRTRERRDSHRRRESSHHRNRSRDRSRDRRRESSRRRSSRHSRRSDHYDRPNRDDRRDSGNLTDTEPVELDLLANPKKIKKDEGGPIRIEEDFSDHAKGDGLGGRKDDFVDDNERFDFEKKNRIDSHHRDSRDRHRNSRDSRDRHRSSRDSHHRDDRHRDGRDSRRRDSRRPDSRRYSDRYDRHDSRRYSGFGSHYMSYEEEQQRRQRVFERFDKLMRRNVPVNKRFLDSQTPLSEQEAEADRLEKHIEVEESIQFQRKALMAVSTGIEFLNNRYNPIGLYLNGWSESVMEDIETYDPVFEDLYEKYHTQVSMSPEFKLVFMLASSAFMYHLSNTLFKSQMPGMNANPDMMKNMRRSAMGAVNGMMGNRPPRAGMENMGMGGDMRPPPMSVPPGGSPQAQPAFGRQMRGPNTNTNDLLNEFMDRNPNNINDKILHEIDDILDNPSDDDDDGPQVRNITLDL